MFHCCSIRCFHPYVTASYFFSPHLTSLLISMTVWEKSKVERGGLGCEVWGRENKWVTAALLRRDSWPQKTRGSQLILSFPGDLTTVTVFWLYSPSSNVEHLPIIQNKGPEHMRSVVKTFHRLPVSNWWSVTKWFESSVPQRNVKPSKSFRLRPDRRLQSADPTWLNSN